jgi:hypothetical protein
VACIFGIVALLRASTSTANRAAAVRRRSLAATACARSLAVEVAGRRDLRRQPSGPARHRIYTNAGRSPHPHLPSIPQTT